MWLIVKLQDKPQFPLKALRLKKKEKKRRVGVNSLQSCYVTQTSTDFAEFNSDFHTRKYTFYRC